MLLCPTCSIRNKTETYNGTESWRRQLIIGKSQHSIRVPWRIFFFFSFSPLMEKRANLDRVPFSRFFFCFLPLPSVTCHTAVRQRLHQSVKYILSDGFTYKVARAAALHFPWEFIRVIFFYFYQNWLAHQLFFGGGGRGLRDCWVPSLTPGAYPSILQGNSWGVKGSRRLRVLFESGSLFDHVKGVYRS